MHILQKMIYDIHLTDAMICFGGSFLYSGHTSCVSQQLVEPPQWLQLDSPK